jgi:hypothetical protein
MPARKYVFGILAFWMATTGWMFHRDLWPRWRPNEPPAYTIDLVDEALVGQAPEIFWNVFNGPIKDTDHKLGRLSTWVQYNELDDTFELHSHSADLTRSFLKLKLHATELDSIYRVNRQGELRGVQNDVTFGASLMGLHLADIRLHLEGVVEGQRFVPQGFINFSGQKTTLQLEPVAVPSQISTLNPLHPVNRISGLRRGQHWRVPLVDPLRDCIAEWVTKQLGPIPGLNSEPQVLRAEVRAEPEILSWYGLEVSCLVIDYQGDDDMAAQTWVRESDGLVLLQEATLKGEKLVLERDRLSKALHRKTGHK